MDSPLLQDIPFRATHFALTIRSPVARGKLLSIWCPKLERSYTLITAKDIPGKNQLAEFPVPILADGEVSYLGEPVALLVGPDRARLASYAEQCKVVVEEEPPVFSAPASLIPPGAAQAPGEIFAQRDYSRGDVEAAFAKAATVVSGTYETGIQEHSYGEPVGAMVEYIKGITGMSREDSDTVDSFFVIHTATQWPYHVSRSAAQVLDLPLSQIVTEPSALGIPMDGKIWYPSLISCQAALAAHLIRRNVRLILNREEDFRFSPKRNASVTRIESALGEKGEILGTRVDLTLDLGAREVFAREILDRTSLGVLGAAGRGAVSLHAQAIKTNIPPQGPFSGFGLAQGIFAMERHFSRIADTLALDPAEWRKDNRPIRDGLAEIVSLKESPVDQLLDTAAAMGDYSRKWASYELLRRRRRQDPVPARAEARRGIGIASGWQGNGFLYAGGDTGSYGVEIALNMDGSLEIRTSMMAGKEYNRIWSNIAKETLAVEEDKVRIICRNTALSPDSGPESLSRNITIVTALVDRCCQAIRKQRFRDPLPITVSTNYHPAKPPQTGFTAPPGMVLDAQGSFGSPGWGAAVVEVEIEPHSYNPVVRGVWLGIDGGKILSEARARRSLKLAGIQALGWASREYLEYQAGGIGLNRMSSYGIPNPGEIPPIHIDFHWSDGGEPRGIGELPFCCIPAAYIQAVSQALDHPFEKIPLKPQDIWEVQEEAEK
jgi:CO/xanthine dehydrogenase Mo-binding subunit